MKGRQFVGAIAGTIGAAAVGNRLVTRRVDPLGPPLERETGSFRWRGMDVSYTEGGDPEDSDMVLVHDVHPAATSREFNRVFDRLAEQFHVFAPDLPGFGRSERPPLTYSGTLYETFLGDFAREVTEDPIGIGSGLGAAYLVAAGRDVPFAQLVLVCPKTTAPGERGRLAGRAVRAPVLGTAAFNAMNARPVLSRAMKTRLLYDPEALSEHDLEYYWQTAHQPGARFAPASFFGGDLDATADLGRVLAEIDTPTTLVWGREAAVPPLRDGREIADAADVKLVVLDQARALPHFEQPGAFFDLLADELAASA